MKRILISFIFLPLTISAFNQAPVGYYSSAKGLSGEPLKTALYNIIKGHTTYKYTSSNTDVWDILKESDRDPDNHENVILFYTGWSVNAAQEYNSGCGWSREHVWAKSRGDFGTSPPAGTDAHHIRPADISVNSARNNRWFDNCNEPYLDAGILTGCFSSSTSWVWQPRDEVKGDVARMIFYMATRYEGENGDPDLEVIDYLPSDNNTNDPAHAKLSTLLQWNQEDPVDEFERNRNEVIYSYQDNRNPYIDHPELVDRIFGDTHEYSKTWTGNEDNLWSNSNNWSGFNVPDAFDNVYIPNNVNNYPTVEVSNECNNILIESNSDGHASLIDNGLLTVYGTAEIQRYFSGNAWHLISPATDNATSNTFLNMYLQEFKTDTYDYFEIASENYQLYPMKGYAVYSGIETDNVISYTGKLNYSPVSYNFVTGHDSYNWNLIGNPYTSSIDWDLVTIPTGMSSEIHYFDSETGNLLSYVKNVGGSGSQFIPPQQGFFICVSQNGIFTLNDDTRTHDNNDAFYKESTMSTALIKLKMSNGNYNDETCVHFNNNANIEHDGVYDAYKMISNAMDSLPQIYSITPSGQRLSINGLPETNQISLGYQCETKGVLKIELDSEDKNNVIYLEDKYNGVYTDLSVSPYEFSHSGGIDNNRFVIHFEAQHIAEKLNNSISIYSTGSDIHINSSIILNDVFASIIDMNGRVVLSLELGSINSHIIKTNLANGVYILRILYGKNIFSSKLMLHSQTSNK